MLQATELHTEHKSQPVIDEVHPALSWIPVSSHSASNQNKSQSAFQIQVATSVDALGQGQADLWDSEKVHSNQTFGVSYKGKSLEEKPLLTCWWRVKLWDEADTEGAWSPASCWCMGLMRPQDWAPASWICLDEPQAATAAANTHGSSHATSGAAAPSGEKGATSAAECMLVAQDPLVLPPAKYFRKEFELEGALGSSTRLGSAAAATTGIGADATAPEAASQQQRGLVPGPEYNVDSDAQALITPAKTLTRAVLCVTSRGIYRAYINGKAVADDYFTPGWTDYSRRLYYQTYSVTDMLLPGSNVLGAVVADGWYAGYIGWKYERNQYGSTLWLLARLQLQYSDGSCQVIATDDSWGASDQGPIQEADFLMGETYDATREMPGWCQPARDTTPASMSLPWSTMALGPWDAVTAAAHDPEGPVLQAYPSLPVQQIAELSPQTVSEPQPGVFVFDLGQNFAGVARLKVRGAQPGQRIVLRYAERLQPDGTLYTENLRSARATDTYICRGSEEGAEEEVWQPLFTYHGFQYVEVTGYPGCPGPEVITGLPLSSSTPWVGQLTTSDARVNKLISNITWTQRCNFLELPTDCPQRDERLGWTGDAQIYIRTAAMFADVQSFFHKWLTDLRDAQADSGQFPMFAPLAQLLHILDQKYSAAQDGGPAWSDAGVICPWSVYEMYGDVRLLSRCYPAMQRFIDFSVERCVAGLRPPAEFHCFGDWLNLGDDTPKDYIFRAYLAHSLDLTAKSAQVLGHSQDAERYSQLLQQAKASFAEDYVEPATNNLKPNSQCAHVLALAFGLLSPEATEAAQRRLAQLIRARDCHLSTGFVGTKDLMRVLSDAGEHALAHTLLRTRTYPSWGFSIDNGATTVWERWDGWTPEKGFQDPGMNSFCHYSFGAVGQWMWEQLVGIQPLEPGFRKIRIAPRPDPAAVAACVAGCSSSGIDTTDGVGARIKGGSEAAGSDSTRSSCSLQQLQQEGNTDVGVVWVEAAYKSVCGWIEINWRLVGGKFRLHVVVPANTMAEIVMPAANTSTHGLGPVTTSNTASAHSLISMPAVSSATGGAAARVSGLTLDSAAADAHMTAGAVAVLVQAGAVLTFGSGAHAYECQLA